LIPITEALSFNFYEQVNELHKLANLVYAGYSGRRMPASDISLTRSPYSLRLVPLGDRRKSVLATTRPLVLQPEFVILRRGDGGCEAATA
jgi:hypothetical protein